MLFVRGCGSNSSIISSAATFRLELGKRAKVPYELVAAVMENTETASCVFKLQDGTWYEVDGKRTEKPSNQVSIRTIDRNKEAPLLLFVRTSDQSHNVVKESIPAAEESMQKNEIDVYTPSHIINSSSDGVSYNLQEPLSLPNIGNSCWIAAGCQLLFCAHVHSGNRLFSRTNVVGNSEIAQCFVGLMNSNNTSEYWRYFYNTVFSISGIDVSRNEQSDSGVPNTRITLTNSLYCSCFTNAFRNTCCLTL